MEYSHRFFFVLLVCRSEKFTNKKTFRAVQIPQSNRKETLNEKKEEKNNSKWESLETKLYKIEKVALFFNLKKMMFDWKLKNLRINQWFYDNYKLHRIIAFVTWIFSWFELALSSLYHRVTNLMSCAVYMHILFTVLLTTLKCILLERTKLISVLWWN